MERERRKIKSKEFKILAGEMSTIDGRVKPNSDKGEIRFYINPDQLLTFQWKNLDKNNCSEPLVIFEGEWEWVKIDTMKGRVYILQNKSFPEDRLFYWMQYPNKSEDSTNETIINNILSSGQLVINESNENEDTGIESVLKREQNQEKAASFKNNNMDNTDFIKNFTNAMKNIERVKYPSLGKILTKNNITKIIDENSFETLINLLPENQQSKDQFIENLSSPQFQQALESLTSVIFYFIFKALNSENLQSIIQSFGLNTQKANNFPNGVEAFIKCIIEKFKKN